MKRIVYFFILLLLFTSCFEEDVRVEPHPPGDLELGKVDLTEDYRYQVFFDLESNSAVAENIISDWDLGFETSDSGWHIILNSTRMMLAGNTLNTSFESVENASGIEMNFDPSHGDLDSTAINEWYIIDGETPVSKGYTYIINRASDENSISMGMKKVEFDFDASNSYVIRYANLDGSDENTATIEKDTSVNFVCFSFDNGIVEIEPPKTSWDLLFTRYSTLLFTDAGEPYPYVVTGVLLNRFNVEANVDTNLVFNDIVYEDVENVLFKTQNDIIGYDWKYYSFDETKYTILPKNIYFIKDTEGYFYKLRFISFYDLKTGAKGVPTFEFAKL